MAKILQFPHKRPLIPEKADTSPIICCGQELTPDRNCSASARIRSSGGTREIRSTIYVNCPTCGQIWAFYRKAVLFKIRRAKKRKPRPKTGAFSCSAVESAADGGCRCMPGR